MTDSSLTIVTVCLNDRTGLERTLSSVLGQSVLPAQVIVVDGGSRDGSAELAAARSDAHPVVESISEPDRGVYDAMNKGLARASSRYVQYLNSGDALADADVVGDFENLARKSEFPLTVHGYTVFVDGSGAPIGRSTNLPYSWLAHLLGRQMHAHPSTFVSSELLRVIGGFSLNYGLAGDYDALLRLFAAARPVDWNRDVARFWPGGMSEVSAAKIPDLLQSVRRDLLNPVGIAGIAEQAWSKAFALNHRRRLRQGRK